jgi:AAA+ ATPase superfamily predicted ATPase
MDNPFRYGHIVIGEAFTDRARELDELVSSARSGQSVVIISPRRYGKTSLVMRARERLVKSGVLVAYADLFRATTKQQLVDELATAVYRGIAGRERERRRIENFSGGRFQRYERASQLRLAVVKRHRSKRDAFLPRVGVQSGAMKRLILR